MEEHRLKKQHTWLLGVALLGASTAAVAQSNDPSVANFTGSLVSNNAANTKAGTLVVQPYVYYGESRHSFDNAGNRHNATPMREWSSIAVVTYGITDTFSAAVVPSVSRASSAGNRADSFRMGDTTLRFQYQLKAASADGTSPAVALAASHRFATGRHDKLADNPLNGTGSGAEVNTFGLFYQQYLWMPNGRPLRLRGNLSWSPRPDVVGIRGASVYGTERGFIGSAQSGSSSSALVAAEYSIDSKWALAMDVGLLRGSKTWLRGVDANGRSVQRYEKASMRWFVAPALEYSVSPRLGFVAGSEITFAGRNARATLTPQASVIFVL
jgi:hypothetical protein